jgi:serine/threonine-protein kinase
MSEDMIGTRKGDYEILGVLGVGGMGKVYRVRNVLSDRIEAMKVLLPNLVDQKDLADRFLREIKVLASLSHPNIAALRTALTIDNQLVMIMEYVEGQTLSARVGQGAIPIDEALNYIGQVLAALSYAHKQQVIHRDIKPANMMLTPEGVIKLMDFGIARSGADMGLTVTGTTLGSLSYMSPEQVKCAPVDARSDLYSLGVSLYEMVTGQRPFQADSHFSILQAHLRELPKPPMELRPELPEAVSEIILKAMEKDPAQRFQSADAFLDAVQIVTGNKGVAREATQALSVAQSSSGAQAPHPRESTVLLTGGRGSGGSPESAPAPQDAPVSAGQLSAQKYRGLYIGLGALIVLLVLVAAGISAPHWLRTRAKNGSSASSKDSSPQPAAADTGSLGAVTPASTPAPSGAAVADASGSTSSSPAATVEPVQPAASDPSPHGASKNPSSATLSSSAVKNSANTRPQASLPADRQQSDASADAQAAVSEEDQLAELDHQADLLSSRETAIGASLDTLQRQQNAQGLQLRGDIVAAQSRMRTHLAKAQAALQAKDLKNARKYLDLAEPDAEKIEEFLGR